MTSYYVGLLGDDSNEGTSSTEAWRTLARANTQPYAPGDEVLLERGAIWTDEQLFIMSSGIDGVPIVIGSFGEGAKPRIQGAGHTACVRLAGLSYVAIRELELIGAGDGGWGAGLYCSDDCHHIEITACDSHGNDRYGMLLEQSHDIAVSDCRCWNNGVSGIQLLNACHDIALTSCFAATNGEEGIDVEASSHTVTLTTCIAAANGKAGFDLDTGVYGIRYVGCISYNNGQSVPEAGNGFKITAGDDILYERCSSCLNVLHGIEVAEDGLGPIGVKLVRCTWTHNEGRGMHLANGPAIIHDCFSSWNGWGAMCSVAATAQITATLGLSQ